jgi:hypothetical protein
VESRFEPDIFARYDAQIDASYYGRVLDDADRRDMEDARSDTVTATCETREEHERACIALEAEWAYLELVATARALGLL